MVLDLGIALALVAANAFFVTTEFALARLRPTQVNAWERTRRPGAKSVRHGIEHIDSYLAACQLGITLASLGLGVVGEPVFHDLLEPVLGDAATVFGFGLAAAVAFFVITMLHVVVGELAPKSLAISRTGPTALIVAPPMRLFYLATRPLVDLFNGMGNLLLKPFGIPPAREAGHAPHTEEELHSLVRGNSELESEEQQLTEAALAFDERRARDVMRPRREVVALHRDDSREQVLSRARETGFTRFPLVERDERGLDSALGIVHLKDILLSDGAVDLGAAVRPVPRVPAGAILPEVLRELRRARQHMAVAVDERGTAVGIVTLEDLLEELVGEIEDEFDGRAAELVAREGDSVVIDGAAPVAVVEEELGIRLTETHEATIGGAIVERIGRVPERGELIAIDGVDAEVIDAREGRVRLLRVTVH